MSLSHRNARGLLVQPFGASSSARRTMDGARRATLVLLAGVAAACSSDSTGPKVATDCASGDVLTPAVGAVTPVPSGTFACAGGGSSGAEYVLIPFNSNRTSAKATFDVEATGLGSLGPASFSILPGSGDQPGGSQLALTPLSGRSTSFEATLRAQEAALEDLIPAVRRAAGRARGPLPSLAVIPSSVTIGQRVELNTNAKQACKDPVYATGRVVAMTAKSIVVADTANPIGGFTDDDYRSIAATFDDVVDPVVTAAFGQPADIDGNGRILLFFTRRVNELTPKDNEDSYVGGFFFGRDLLPATSGSCATSNYGEMFYLLVPDPTGVVNGNEFSRENVRDIAVSIVAHEYQHLINASRRMYVSTTAEEFEEVWLNEGLSHIAEELVFYAESGKQPRRDLDPAAIRSSAQSIDAFNNHVGANFGRFRQFLMKPGAFSPYGENDSLATRGATWAFLRYAADRQATAESSIWFQLANSGKVGFDNLTTVFGSDVTGLLRDWSTSAFTDNVPGVAARYQQPSWKFRAIYHELYSTYPLATMSLVAGTPRSVSVVGGGSAYLRFAVPAGGAGQVTWGSVPSNVQMTLVRTR